MTTPQRKPSATIASAIFSDGTSLSFLQNEITVFVGPNNSGKSASLKNIFDKAKSTAADGVVVREISIRREGGESEVLHWVKSVSKCNKTNPSNPTYSRLGASVTENHAKSYWAQTGSLGLEQLAPFFVYLLSTESRLKAASPASNIALTTEALTHPIHYLQVDDRLEEKISGYFKQAFGEDLIVHRNAGNSVPLHCGERPIPGEGEDRVSTGYIERLEQLPTLHTQGDGMRSFVGVLLHSLVVDHSTILVDEPEAFLHPPQARLLGSMLVNNAPDDRQMFIATHSGNFIRGLLDSASDRVRIVRLQREGDINKVKELDADGVQEIWSDPLLRHSNILDGLFYERVILCESDSDCRFYSAVLDALFEQEEGLQKPDFMFTHCGGKYRLPVVINALVSLGVPVSVIADFDVLNADSPLKMIFESLGGSWPSVETKWKLVKSSVEAKKPELSTKDVKSQVESILSSTDDVVFPQSAAKKIQKVLKQSSPWSIAKSVGKNYVPSGEPTQQCGELLKVFEEHGLFVVEEGELEGFLRSVGNHGPKWVNEVLGYDLKKAPELSRAREFVTKVLSSHGVTSSG